MSLGTRSNPRLKRPVHPLDLDGLELAASLGGNVLEVAARALPES